MQNKRCFEAVDRTLKDIGSNNTLFGGLLVLLGGDFAQIPPVVRHGNRSAIVEASVEQSYIWPQSQVLYLKHNMRARGTSTNEIYFKKWLHLITYNKLIQNARVPPPQYIPQTYSLNKLIYRVHPAQMLHEAVYNPPSLCRSAILTSRNGTVDAINQKVLDMMPGKAVSLISADKADYSDEENVNNKLYRISNEYLQTLGPSNFPLAKLVLKVGCIVMLLRNLNPRKGLCNGTRLMIKEIGRYILKVQLLKTAHT